MQSKKFVIIEPDVEIITTRNVDKNKIQCRIRKLWRPEQEKIDPKPSKIQVEKTWIPTVINKANLKKILLCVKYGNQKQCLIYKNVSYLRLKYFRRNVCIKTRNIYITSVDPSLSLLQFPVGVSQSISFTNDLVISEYCR